MQPALGGPDIRDVSGPDPIGLRHGELPIERILCHGQPVIRLGRRAPRCHDLGSEARLAHQPGHAMLSDIMPLLA